MLTNSGSSGSWSHAVTGLLRRFSSEAEQSDKTDSSMHSSQTFPSGKKNGLGLSIDGTYTPPYRTASPFQPPPLYPLVLKGYHPDTPPSARLLSRALAEEIRLLVPPRLQLCEDWNLVYSLEQDGVSLATLYKNCEDLRGLRNGFVLVVKDSDGSVRALAYPATYPLMIYTDYTQLFGAYLTEAPHPYPHYYGTGECFLWRASFLSPTSLQHLPPPPSADTTNVQRTTTIRTSSPSSPNESSNNLALPGSGRSGRSGTSTPEHIRFKAFPYSGVNDYMMLCENSFLSVGSGDGHYGLWLDDSFEKGVSSSCPTFGNEPLSDEGEKFDIIGVELWTIGDLPH